MPDATSWPGYLGLIKLINISLPRLSDGLVNRFRFFGFGNLLTKKWVESKVE